MSPPPHPDHGDEAAVVTDVTGLTLDDGGFVIYDPNREDAWLQSSDPATLPEWR